MESLLVIFCFDDFFGWIIIAKLLIKYTYVHEKKIMSTFEQPNWYTYINIMWLQVRMYVAGIEWIHWPSLTFSNRTAGSLLYSRSSSWLSLAQVAREILLVALFFVLSLIGSRMNVSGEKFDEIQSIFDNARIENYEYYQN